MSKFRGFRQMTGRMAESQMHASIRGKIARIRENCGFPTGAAFDAFWAVVNDHLRGDWPDYEDNRRGALFSRAADGEKITRAELIGPHLEIEMKLPPEWKRGVK